MYWQVAVLAVPREPHWLVCRADNRRGQTQKPWTEPLRLIKVLGYLNRLEYTRAIRSPRREWFVKEIRFARRGQREELQ